MAATTPVMFCQSQHKTNMLLVRRSDHVMRRRQQGRLHTFCYGHVSPRLAALLRPCCAFCTSLQVAARPSKAKNQTQVVEATVAPMILVLSDHANATPHWCHLCQMVAQEQTTRMWRN